MGENFIVIQLIFADKFVSQDFTIKAAPGLSGPVNTWDKQIQGRTNFRTTLIMLK